MENRKNIYLIHGLGLILSISGIGCDRASDHIIDKTKASHREKHIPTDRTIPDDPTTTDLPELQLGLADILDGHPQELRQRIEHWKKLPPEKAGPLLLTLARLGRGDLALEVIQNWPTEPQDQAITLIFSGLTGTPADQWQLASTLNDRQHQQAQSELLRKGAQEDPATWCELAWQHRNQLSESTSWQTCLTAWSEKDPAAFGSWLNEHTLPQKLQDETVRLLVMRADSENRSAETAVAWAETVRDPQLRLSTLEHALRELCHEKGCAPEDAISSCTSLNESEKTTLLDQLSQERKSGFSPPDD